MAVPSEIASVAAFFSSGLSAFVTGQTLVVDGGIINSFPYPMADLQRLATERATAAASRGTSAAGGGHDRQSDGG
jgi:hypothetical protein